MTTYDLTITTVSGKEYDIEATVTWEIIDYGYDGDGNRGTHIEGIYLERVVIRDTEGNLITGVDEDRVLDLVVIDSSNSVYEQILEDCYYMALDDQEDRLYNGN